MHAHITIGIWIVSLVLFVIRGICNSRINNNVALIITAIYLVATLNVCEGVLNLSWWLSIGITLLSFTVIMLLFKCIINPLIQKGGR